MRSIASAVADAILLVYAYAAFSLLSLSWGAPPEMLISLASAMAPFIAIHLLCLAVFGAYDFSNLRSESDIAFSAFMGVAAGVLASLALATVFILYYAPETPVISRFVFFGAGLSCALVLPGWRIWYTRQRRHRGELDTRVLVVGARNQVRAVAGELDHYARGGHQIVGCVADDDAELDAPFVGHVAELPSLVRSHRANEILALGESLPHDPQRLLALLDACKETGLPLHVLPGAYEALMGKLDLYEIGGVPLIKYRAEPLRTGYAFVKRAMDIAGALVGLALSAPLMLLTAAAIKYDSPGPVFYRQRRYGLKGKEFELVKLRSMRVDAEKDTGAILATPQDPRVTRVGRFLRNKRIDEIPQFWNVLKGEMSLIGPRPERPELAQTFGGNTPLFPLRLRVRPGITSLSHVLGRYDSIPAHRLLYDFAYMNSLSFMLDVRIIVATIKIVLTGRGAQ